MTLPRQTEAAFQAQVTQLAELCGWSWVHHRPAMTATSWRTPVSGPLGKGWPDLLLVRPSDLRVLAVELKRDGARTTPAQDAVLEILAASGIETWVWHPADWDALVAVLR